MQNVNSGHLSTAPPQDSEWTSTLPLFGLIWSCQPFAHPHRPRAEVRLKPSPWEFPSLWTPAYSPVRNSISFCPGQPAVVVVAGLPFYCSNDPSSPLCCPISKMRAWPLGMKGRSLAYQNINPPITNQAPNQPSRRRRTGNGVKSKAYLGDSTSGTWRKFDLALWGEWSDGTARARSSATGTCGDPNPVEIPYNISWKTLRERINPIRYFWFKQ